jgi:hypothetical protein
MFQIKKTNSQRAAEKLRHQPRGKSRSKENILPEKALSSEWYFVKANADHILKWLALTYGYSQSHVAASEKYLMVLRNLIKRKTTAYAISVAKEVRLRVSHYIAKITEFRVSSKVMLTYDGLPAILSDLIPIIRTGAPRNLRWCLTIVNWSRTLRLPASPNVETITRPYTGLPFKSMVIVYMPKFILALQQLTPKRKFPDIWESLYSLRLNIKG